MLAAHVERVEMRLEELRRRIRYVHTPLFSVPFCLSLRVATRQGEGAYLLAKLRQTVGIADCSAYAVDN